MSFIHANANEWSAVSQQNCLVANTAQSCVLFGPSPLPVARCPLYFRIM